MIYNRKLHQQFYMNSLKLIAMLVRGAHPTNCIFQTGSYSSSCALSSFRLGCVRESLFSNSEISLTLLARLCTFEQYSRRCQSNVPEKGGEILTIWSLWLTCEKVGSGVQHHRGGARCPAYGFDFVQLSTQPNRCTFVQSRVYANYKSKCYAQSSRIR